MMKFFNQLRCIIAFTFLCIPLASPIVNASEDSALERQLENANEAYASGKYEEAIPKYREIIARYGFSPEVLHNLGNSYAGAKQHGLAILHYLRGLSLAPGDDDLQGSLEMVRKNSGLFESEKTPFEKFIHLFDMNQWTLAVLLVYVALTFLLFVHLFFPIKKGVFALCGIHLLLIAVCIIGAAQQYTRWSGGVVIKSSVRLLMSPFPSALSQGILDEGSRVYSEKVHGKYHYIKDEKGRNGWVESTAFRTIKASHLKYSLDNAEQ